MRIASLDPSLTDTIVSFGLEANLVGITHHGGVAGPAHVTAEGDSISGGRAPLLESSLCRYSLLTEQFLACDPDIVVSTALDDGLRTKLRAELESQLGHPVALHLFPLQTLENALAMFEGMGKALRIPEKGIALAHRVKAQCMDWVNNFYQRMKNKRVVVIARLDPLCIGGLWIPDLVRGCSAVSMSAPRQLERNPEVTWQDIEAFNPDVIVVAPEDADFLGSKRAFLDFERVPGWESMHAVKRGEVYFTDGTAFFHRASPQLIDTMAVLVSCVAGLESGYISRRDSFVRLRYLEMHRHTLR